ncbi:MFS transporter [Aspergillus affinis]|uniref:MFS transporter n=1 Tax=Aspergillus affinis TaxID=1070780 RepID=UPI0022FF0EC2|nr:MFS general substrate transporter [Aspergillus affinis]KAI9034811.1 MFS general substrate transporter [Aspergillus affinis]
MLASSMMSPALVQIQAEFKDSSPTLITFTVSIYIIGTAVGPLVLAPLSETYGRSWIYHAGNVSYTVFAVACALSPSASTLLAFRFLGGLAGSIPISNAGGTIADMITPERRGLINSVFGAALILSPALAPIAGGFLAADMGWRWIFWLITILSGVTTIISFGLLRETFSPILLQRKAARLRRETGNSELQARGKTHQLPLVQKLRRALRRPMVLLATSPILIIASFYLAFVYGTCYLLLTSMPLVFRDVYDWSEGALGLCSLSLGIGCLIGVFITGRYSDRIYQRKKEKSGDSDQPESRLFFLLPAAVALPAGLLIYGWTVHFKSHWIAPLIGTGIFGVGLVLSYSAINNYLIDAFSIYAASALAASGLFRGLAGGLLPLSGPKMYEHLGYGWGNTLLGLLSVGFGGVSLIIWAFGKDLRMRYPVDLE